MLPAAISAAANVAYTQHLLDYTPLIFHPASYTREILHPLPLPVFRHKLVRIGTAVVRGSV